MDSLRPSASGLVTRLFSVDISKALLRQRTRTGFCKFNCVVQFLFHAGSVAGNELVGQESFSQVIRLNSCDWIFGLPPGNFFRWPIMARVAAGVSRNAISFQLQQSRPLAHPRPLS